MSDTAYREIKPGDEKGRLISALLGRDDTAFIQINEGPGGILAYVNHSAGPSPTRIAIETNGAISIDMPVALETKVEYSLSPDWQLKRRVHTNDSHSTGHTETLSGHEAERITKALRELTHRMLPLLQEKNLGLN